MITFIFSGVWHLYTFTAHLSCQFPDFLMACVLRKQPLHVDMSHEKTPSPPDPCWHTQTRWSIFEFVHVRWWFWFLSSRKSTEAERELYMHLLFTINLVDFMLFPLPSHPCVSTQISASQCLSVWVLQQVCAGELHISLWWLNPGFVSESPFCQHQEHFSSTTLTSTGSYIGPWL